MEKEKSLLACHDGIKMIEREIEAAELHLEHALEYAHHCAEKSALYIEGAEQRLAWADKMATYKHKHLGKSAGSMGSNPHPVDHHHQSARDLWATEHPDLHEDIDEVKHKIKMHKERHGSGSRY